MSTTIETRYHSGKLNIYIEKRLGDKSFTTKFQSPEPAVTSESDDYHYTTLSLTWEDILGLHEILSAQIAAAERED